MGIKDIISNIIKKADTIQGVERDLLKRKRAGTIGWITALVGAIHQVLVIIFSEEYLKNIINDPAKVAKEQPGYLIGLVIFTIGFGIYFTVKRTKILLKESEEPFRYTFWIKSFEPVKETPGERFKLKKDDRFHLLHHDLMERLNDRIRRLSLLDSSSLKVGEAVEGKLTSHIHIEGHYAIREKKDGEWIVHVMPRVRIGPSTNPAVLAAPVKFPIYEDKRVKDNKPEDIKAADENAKDKSSENEKPVECNLDADRYNQIVERLYSSIATEIYRQIELDLKEKTTLFPTSYLRACAYYYEAEDFARSNTIDAYDRAIELYKEALRYFNIANIKPITNLFLKFPPLLWRREVKFVHMQSRVRIGYARCLVYRRILSALSGRYKNPLFAIRSELDEVINNLLLLHNRINKGWRLILPGKNADTEHKEKKRLKTIMAFLTFPKDTWGKYLTFIPFQYLFERQSHLLFDAYVVAALTHHQLGAIQKANDYLEDAKSIAPMLSDKNALFLFTSGEIEPDIDKAIFLLRQATEIAPDFQIAQYSLAYYCEMKFRMQNELVKERADSIIKEYDRVLELNPGNIASLSAQGYLLWLLKNYKEAEKKFEEGCDVKAIVRQTFIGQLNYGLARIAAEEGDFNKSYDRYNDAISSDPGVGAYSATTDVLSTVPYYDYINSAMLGRYTSFKETVENKISNSKKLNEFSQKTINVVHSFALNDYGNACLNYYHRFGDMEKLEEAIKTFNQAIEKYPQNRVAHFNLQNAYAWRNVEGDIEKGIECLQKVKSQEGPIWPVAVITLVQSILRQEQEKIRKKIQEVKEDIEKANKLENEFKGFEYRRAGVSDRTENIIDSAEIYKLQKEIQERKEKARNGYDNVKCELSECFKNILHEIKDNIRITKLSAIYEGFEFKIDGQGVDKLLSEKEKIERDRLDENDIGALRFWAVVLSNNFLSNSAQNAAKKLCEYIEDEYYPNNFDTNLILYDMYLRVKGITEIKSRLGEEGKEAEAEECNKKIEHYAKIINPTIENWLNRDPNKYTSFRWAEGFFREEELIKFYERATKNAVIQNKLGNIYWEIKNWEEAINAYTTAFKLDNQPIYLCNLGRAHGNLSEPNWDKMIEHCQRAVDLRRSKPSDAFGLDYYYEYLAEGYFKAERLKEFKDYFEKSGDLKDEPKKKAIIYNRIGNLLARAGQVQEAIPYYEKAIKLDSECPIYECNLGLTYGKLLKPDWEKMIEYCGRAVELRRDALNDPYGLDYYYDFLTEAYFMSGKLKEFEGKFEKSGDLKNEPKKKARIYNRIGNLLAKGQRQQQAIIYYEEAIELDSESPIYECNLGLTYEKLPKPDLDKMIEHYSRAVELSRRMPDEYGLSYYYEYLAEGYFKANRLREFEDIFEKSEDLKDKPEEKARIYNRIGNLFFETYENKKSIPYYKKATELAPAIAVYYANLGGTYRELKQWDESNEAYLTAVKIEPNNAGYHNSLGNIYYEIGSWEEAKKSYSMAIELDNQPIFLCNLGRAYGNLGQLNEMIKYCSKAVELRRTTPTDAFGLDYYYAFLAEGYFNAGRLEEFEKFFEKSGDLKNEPDKKAIVYNQIGNLFFNTRKESESIPYYKRATELAPNVAVYHANLGGSYRALKQLDEAIKEYELAIEKAMKINPDDKTFHQYLSLIYNDRGVEHYNKQEDDKAIEDYKKAIELNDHDPVIYHNLYLAYFAKGMYKEAKEAINKALALSPDNQTFSQALNTLMSKGI